jgi:hypothetical protein
VSKRLGYLLHVQHAVSNVLDSLNRDAVPQRKSHKSHKDEDTYSSLHVSAIAMLSAMVCYQT